MLVSNDDADMISARGVFSVCNLAHNPARAVNHSDQATALTGYLFSCCTLVCFGFAAGRQI